MSWTNKNSFRRTFDHSFVIRSLVHTNISGMYVGVSSAFIVQIHERANPFPHVNGFRSTVIMNQQTFSGSCIWTLPLTARPSPPCLYQLHQWLYYSDTWWYSIKSLPLTIDWVWKIDTDPWQEYSRSQLVRTKVAELEWSLEISWQSGWERTSWLFTTFSIIEKEPMNCVTRPLTPIFNWNQRRFANQNLSVHHCSKLLRTLVLH